MYKGKKTLFYNGEILYDYRNREWLIYDEEEQMSWEVVIVLPGVEVIPRKVFSGCDKIETVIMSDTVLRIEEFAFDECHSLKFVRLSRNLEYIGDYAFCECTSLTAIFIPSSCREIGRKAFDYCSKLIIFNIPRQTQLAERVIANTALIEVSPFETTIFGDYDNTKVHEWAKEVNQGEAYELHRVCSSINPSMDKIYGIVKRKGLDSWKMKNELGLTPFDYLAANPCVENQRALIKLHVLNMMGEIE